MEMRDKDTPSHRADQRLTKAIRLPGHLHAGAALAQSISRQTEVDVRMEPPLLDRRLSAAVDGRPATEIMDALAVLFGASWQPVDGAYALVTDPRLAP